jgi:hypothetical protein
MTEVEFPRRLLLPRDLNSRPISADFRTGMAYRGRGGELEGRERPAMNEDIQNHRTAEMSAEAALSRTLLDEIATLVQGLTYGEMIELSEAMWKLRAEGSGVTQENLPEMLHRWSKSRAVIAHDASKEMPSE